LQGGQIKFPSLHKALPPQDFIKINKSCLWALDGWIYRNLFGSLAIWRGTILRKAGRTIASFCGRVLILAIYGSKSTLPAGGKVRRKVWEDMT
jgi:hypothetical protein